MESEDPQENKARKADPAYEWITYDDPAEGWRPFLKEWSEQYIAWHDPDREPPPGPEAVRDGWLGFAPADPAEVTALEERLGLTLPRSLRDLLLTTDGWRATGFCPAIAGAAEIGFMRDLDSRWIRIARKFDEYGGFYWPGTTVLQRGVLLSPPGDDGALFLDPEDVDEAGEWTAYLMVTGSPDQGYRSLYDLLEDAYVNFHLCRYPYDE